MSKAKAQERKDRFRRCVVVTIASAAVLGLIILIVAGSGVLPANMTVLTIDGVKISGAEFDFHYYNEFQQTWRLYQEYDMLHFLNLDPNRSFRRQEAGGDRTWAQIFEEEAISTLSLIVAQSEAAKREGIGLTAEDRETLDSSVEYVELVAEMNGVSADRFLRSQYGRGITLKSYRAILERIFLSDRYTTDFVEALNWTSDDLEEYYQNNREDFDFIDFHAFIISAVPADLQSRDEEYTEEELEEYRDAQKKKAEEMLSRVTVSEAFWELSLEYIVDEDEHDDDDHDHDDEDITLFEKISVGTMGSDPPAVYLTDEARRPGDKTLIEDEDEFVILLFVSRYREEGASTDEEVKALAESILAGWLNGGAGEDAFAELARLHSADGNSDRGGIYEGVRRGQMVETFNDWCFDPERKPGDSGIVETQFGQHIMFFVGVNEDNEDTIDVRHILIQKSGWKNEAKTAMDSEAYLGHKDEKLENTNYKRNWFGMWFTKSRSA
jgi:hypothetical protein